MTSDSAAELKSDALHFHAFPRPGKLQVMATKPLANQRDLALAYSPGVAFACEAIQADPHEAARLTARQNLVAVLTNGTAVLGLGAIGPLAAKPVMEGKAVLFKKFAGIDVFDIEVNETNVEKLVDLIVALEPTFGGINLEDIKGPECFDVEEKAKARMGIPVFHDDQHGTAIIVGAAVVNAMEIAGKKIDEVKIVCVGAGAAALASLNLLVSLGARRKNIYVCDIEGVVYKGREELMDRWKAVYAQETSARALADVIDEADIFLGLSAAGVYEAGVAHAHGARPADHGARQSDTGNHARTRHRCAAGRDDLHRAFGLSQPGQQRALLSLHLPRRARRWRLGDQRGDEEGGGGGDRRAGARSAVRSRRSRLWRRGAAVRPRTR